MFGSSSQRVSLRMWVLAALGSVAIHLGCVALALEYLRDDDVDEAPGAPAVEIGVELLAPRLEAIELPPGPNVDASVASPRVVEQNAIVEAVVLPQAVPTETEDPERVVVAVEASRPKEVSEVPAPPAIPAVESAASEATAPPTSETIPVSVRSVTPVQGTGESPERVRATWEKDLIAHFNRHKRYPDSRSSQDIQILVGLTLDETGHVLSSRIVKGSGDASFDAAALAMIARSDPVPRPPLRVAQEGLSFTLPVVFRAKRGN